MACSLTHPPPLCLQRAYVRYPPEGPRPPSLEELQEILRGEKQERK